jgi:hypothetical protein
VTIFPEKNKKGEFAIELKKKKREIIQEVKKRVEIPPEVGDEEEKPLKQTGDYQLLDGKLNSLHKSIICSFYNKL